MFKNYKDHQSSPLICSPLLRRILIEIKALLGLFYYFETQMKIEAPPSFHFFFLFLTGVTNFVFKLKIACSLHFSTMASILCGRIRKSIES